jgi:hypothetical protein
MNFIEAWKKGIGYRIIPTSNLTEFHGKLTALTYEDAMSDHWEVVKDVAVESVGGAIESIHRYGLDTVMVVWFKRSIPPYARITATFSPHSKIPTRD